MADTVTEAKPDTEDLLFRVDGPIAYATFNRPQARNAMTFAMYDRLIEICEQVGADKSIRCLVLNGAGGKAFASGTDISQFREFKTEADPIAYEQRIDKVLGTLERCPTPTIAAINGACTGGGAGIAAACDLRICEPGARFGFPVARTLGNCLSMANYTRLTALVGPARLKEMVFTARLLGAEEAKHIGLVSEVVADVDSLMPRATEIAQTITTLAPLTLRATKEATRRIKEKMLPEEGRDLVLMCYLSKDFREGLEAFLGKRKANWQGE